MIQPLQQHWVDIPWIMVENFVAIRFPLPLYIYSSPTLLSFNYANLPIQQSGLMQMLLLIYLLTWRASLDVAKHFPGSLIIRTKSNKRSTVSFYDWYYISSDWSLPYFLSLFDVFYHMSHFGVGSGSQKKLVCDNFFEYFIIITTNMVFLTKRVFTLVVSLVPKEVMVSRWWNSKRVVFASNVLPENNEKQTLGVERKMYVLRILPLTKIDLI